MFFIADEKHISDVTRELQKLESKYKNIYIAGAGNIGKSLAKKTNEDFNIKLIEKSEEQSELANEACLLYTSPSPRDGLLSRMPSSA